MNMLLVRHGESIWNKEQRIQGSGDPGLSEEGMRQARSLAKRLRDERVEVIYASGLKRCVQTARIIAKSAKTKIRFHPGIEEIILGEWQGKTVEEVKKEYPGIYSSWLKSPSKARIPGWEGISRFTKRVDGAFKFILSSDSASSVCVVTHWGVIAAYFSKMLEMDFDRFFQSFRIDNCGISKITHRDGKPLVECINDTRHLEIKR
ncbi:MAG: histidine phosphatase family protein [Candidatus Omnitrophota bacterium]